jgi:chemotaxis protein methyltransferase CheR
VNGIDALIEALSRRIGLSPDAAPAARARAYGATLAPDRLAGAIVDLDAGRRSPDVDALVEQATNRETYLFRDRRQLALLEREIGGMIRAQTAPRTISIWSAGCATGEEAYTLAVVGLRALAATGAATLTADGDVRFVDGWSLRVLGTDICADAIARATKPHFRAGPMASFRDPSPGDLALFRAVDGVFVPAPSLARCVRCVVANLLDGVPAGGPFDVVVCRNVLFYFADVHRRRAISTLTAATALGGRLLLGSTDPGPDDPAFVGRHDNGAIIHVRAS